MTIKVYKGIGYAYPTSEMAEKLGFGDTGCYYSYTRKEGCGIDARFSAAFERPDDPELMARYLAHPAEPCWMFKQYADPRIMAAVQAAIQAAEQATEQAASAAREG